MDRGAGTFILTQGSSKGFCFSAADVKEQAVKASGACTVRYFLKAVIKSIFFFFSSSIGEFCYDKYVLETGNANSTGSKTFFQCCKAKAAHHSIALTGLSGNKDCILASC